MGRLVLVSDMAYAEDLESQGAYGFFSAFDHGESVGSDGRAPRDARTQTWLGGGVGGREIERVRKCADVRLGEASVTQGCDYAKLGGGDAAGTIMVHVVGVFAVSDRAKAALMGQGIET